MKKKIIIAGNYRQAHQYAMEHGFNMQLGKEWIYVDEPHRIRGLKNFEIIYTGQYYLNPMYDIECNKTELEMRSKMD